MHKYEIFKCLWELDLWKTTAWKKLKKKMNLETYLTRDQMRVPASHITPIIRLITEDSNAIKIVIIMGSCWKNKTYKLIITEILNS